jgi:thioredoxin-dependent peroxiredoxin
MKIGDKIPSFELPDDKGGVFKSDDVLGKKNMVIYFYPKDETPGCINEACAFRDSFEDFLNLDCEVIGISSDSIDSHQEFSLKYKLPFTLLSDSSKSIRRLFNVPNSFFGLIPGRVTYVVNKEGVVIEKFNSLLNSKKHIEMAKQALLK